MFFAVAGIAFAAGVAIGYWVGRHVTAERLVDRRLDREMALPPINDQEQADGAEGESR